MPFLCSSRREQAFEDYEEEVEEAIPVPPAPAAPAPAAPAPAAAPTEAPSGDVPGGLHRWRTA